jgi:putative ABC transport system permease protein
MIFDDVIRHSSRAILGHRQRSALTILGIVIGIASVILLTSIGEGTRLYILNQFTQFGTNMVSITPGKMKTTGMPGAVGGTMHPLTLGDVEVLDRVRGVEKTVPMAMGTAAVQYGGKERSTYVYGVTCHATTVWRIGVRLGRFLPPGDARYGSALAVLGPTLKRELFGDGNALGEHVRIGGQRFLIIGITESKGQFVGLDVDDAAYVPVSVALPMLNRSDLQGIDVQISNSSVVDSTVARMRQALMARHGGEEDFTITTQTGMLETLGRIIRIISLAVVGIGAISLLVGAIGILTMMWISVNERTGEIGLAKALGATPGQILLLFLSEAVLLSLAGGVVGLAVGISLGRLIHLFIPGLPVNTPLPYVALALGVSLTVGLASGILPARRAAALDPVEALSGE